MAANLLPFPRLSGLWEMSDRRLIAATRSNSRPSASIKALFGVYGELREHVCTCEPADGTCSRVGVERAQVFRLAGEIEGPDGVTLYDRDMKG